MKYARKLVLVCLVLACAVSLFGCVADYQVETRRDRTRHEHHPLNSTRHLWQYDGCND